MTPLRFLSRRGRIPSKLLLSIWMLGGCGFEKRVQPVLVPNEVLGPMTIAVAPAINLSGSPDFDLNRVADLMASELSYAEAISVVPVSRVLGVLAAEGLDGVESPAHAMELARWLGVNAILVFAVTEYDPYDPPSIGISAQLYGTRPRPGGRTLDPIELSRQASLSATEVQSSRRGILAQTQRVFDASHASVVADVQRFARHRSADRSPYGWRKFVVSQQEFVRYCCNRIIRALLAGEDEVVGVGMSRER